MKKLVVVLITLFFFSYGEDSLSTVVEKSPFPLQATVLQIKDNGDGQLAIQIAYYNESTTPIKGFTGKIRFTRNDTTFLEMILKIAVDIPVEENKLWWGAIPFDATNPLENSLVDINTEGLKLDIIVSSIVKANGTEKFFDK